MDIPLLIRLLCCLLFEPKWLHTATKPSAKLRLDFLPGEAQFLQGSITAYFKYSEVSPAKVLLNTTQVVLNLSADFKQYVI